MRSTRTRLPALLPALALALLAGCGQGSPGTGTDATPDDAPSAPVAAGEYDGEWVARSVPGHPGAPGLRLTLDGDRLAFSAGCNHYSGMVEVADGRLDVGSLGGTEMGCPDGGELDEWLVDFFSRSETIARVGDGLAVTSGEDTITFRPVAEPSPAAAPELTSERWALTEIAETGDGLASSTVPPRGSWVQVVDGELRWSDGCNSGAGPVRVRRGVLELGAVSSTRRGCPGDAHQADSRRRIAEVLAPGTVRWALADGRLELRRKTGPGHEVVLGLRPADDV